MIGGGAVFFCSLLEGLAVYDGDVVSREPPMAMSVERIGSGVSLVGGGITLRLTGSELPLNQSAIRPPLASMLICPVLSPVSVGVNSQSSFSLLGDRCAERDGDASPVLEDRRGRELFESRAVKEFENRVVRGGMSRPSKETAELECWCDRAGREHDSEGRAAEVV